MDWLIKQPGAGHVSNQIARVYGIYNEKIQSRKILIRMSNIMTGNDQTLWDKGKYLKVFAIL
jgi:hypothetical protein